MTEFWRDGYWRTSVNGLRHWVGAHPVNREDWSRYGYAGSTNEHFRAQLLEARISNSETSRFVNPNANCPVCNAPVFYYQNEFGSRVFFDELGPPWPKHPCTDNVQFRTYADGTKEFTFVEPQARTDDDVSKIQQWLNSGSFNFDQMFAFARERKGWTIVKIVRCFRSSGKHYLILKSLDSGASKEFFIICSSLPKKIKWGSVIAIKNDKISVLNPKTLEPKEIVIERFRSAKKFLARIIGEVA